MGDKWPGAIFCLKSRGRVSHSRDWTHICAPEPSGTSWMLGMRHWNRFWKAGSSTSDATDREKQGSSLGKGFMVRDEEGAWFQFSTGLGKALQHKGGLGKPPQEMKDSCRERKQVQPEPRGRR